MACGLWFCIILIRWFVYVVLLLCFLVCERFRRQSIFDQIEATNQIIVVNILQNRSHMYSSHYISIKCVGFKSIHYAINLKL